ncbi:MAG: hypothetical protein QGI83_10855, partial [Candidatus Latescibacteria bacterium]|nr:hypothetical protein [Candidatus Latescibacterota bacterium]
MALHTSPRPSASPDPHPMAHGITPRSAAVGILAAAVISGWITYSRTAADTSAINITHLPVSLFVVFLLVVTANLLWRASGRGPGLAPSELLTVLAVGLVAAMIPARGLTGIWLGLLAVPYYRGTPENGWIEHIQPHLPSHLYPTNEGLQTTFLYEGLPPGAEVPWNAWLTPVFWWVTLILAGFTVCVSIVVILRKQWVEHERLDYPLLAPILELIEDSGDGAPRWPALFSGRLFWIGFALAFGIIAWNTNTYFHPTWPRINMSPSAGLFYFARLFPPLLTHINTYTIGFAYFVNLEILFSIWFFHFVLMTEIAVIRKTGFQLGKMHASGGSWGDPLVRWQSLGALFAFVAWGLWTARRHLKAVFTKALSGNPEVDDSSEILSYRTAVLGLILGTLFIAAWLWRAGVEPRLVA